MKPFPYDAAQPRTPSNEEMECYQDAMQQFAQLNQWRSQAFAGHWEEVAELILPTHRNTFYYGSYNTPGEKKTQRQVDATGMMALSRFAAICDSLLTPRNSAWHQVTTNDDRIMKDRGARLWFEQATKLLFKHRYAPTANFSSQNLQNYVSLGAFGNGIMFVDPLQDVHHTRGLRYRSIPLGEVFFVENHQGQINGVIRWFKMTAAQAEKMWPNMLPPQLQTALKMQSEQKFNFLHRVVERNDYDSKRLDYKGMPYQSTYVCIEGQCLMFREGAPYEGGFTTFPYAASRYDQAPNEVYGRSPAMMVLPALKTLNAQKRVFLKQGHRAADPVLLTADDGIINLDLRPGALNKGGVSSDGKPLVTVLPTGDIQVNEKMMEMERSLINDAFLVNLFQVLTETPTMTATEVIERTNEKGILLAPTVGRQQSEYLGPMIDRELDLMVQLKLLPPLPPALKEAQGEYHVVYTSPLSRAQRAQEAAGFMRTLETVKELVSITQDPSLLDQFNFDTAVPAIAEIQAVPASWMADDQQVAEKRKARAQQQAKQQEIQAAPANAAIMKARAAMMQAGVDPNGGGGVQ